MKVFLTDSVSVNLLQLSVNCTVGDFPAPTHRINLMRFFPGGLRQQRKHFWGEKTLSNRKRRRISHIFLYRNQTDSHSANVGRTFSERFKDICSDGLFRSVAVINIPMFGAFQLERDILGNIDI